MKKKDLNPDLIYVAQGSSPTKFFVKGDLSKYTLNKSYGLSNNFTDCCDVYDYELASSTDTLWFNELLYSVNNVEKGSYIVVLKINSSDTKCAKENYIFKQRETENHMCPCIDLDDHTSNANSNFTFDKKDMLKDWRYATNKEVELYESVGKPCDINDFIKKQSPKFEVGKWYKIGDKHQFIAKFKEINDNHFISDGYFIYGNKYEESTCNGKITDRYHNAIECSLDEIKHLLPKNHPDLVNKIEEWAISSYVVFIDFYGSSRKGDIDKIIDNLQNLWCEKEKITTKSPNYVKWFATLEEAKRFSDSLLNKPLVKPEYVKCIYSANQHHLTVGRIYKINSDGYAIGNDGLNSWVSWDNSNNSQFEPSTEYEYETQLFSVEPRVNYNNNFVPLEKIEPIKPSDNLEFQQVTIIKTKRKKNNLITINQ